MKFNFPKPKNILNPENQRSALNFYAAFKQIGYNTSVEADKVILKKKNKSKKITFNISKYPLNSKKSL